MKQLTAIVMGLAFTFTLSAGARAADKASAEKAPAAKAGDTATAGKSKEVTLSGDLGCGKCNFKTTKECQNILKVSEGGKDVMYYLAKNDVSNKNHDEVCSGSKPATVTGVVSDEGKGAKKKKLLTASAIQIK
jgi:hypothetical protein